MNNFHPLVSIVIPVYNGENYLRCAIDSALAQTYDNIEVIVVNDGSTDNTEKIAVSYGDKIRYFSKPNSGVSTALNMGIANMQGEYFSWLSHDDLYMPEKIEKNISSIKDFPERIVYSDWENINKHGKSLNKVCVKEIHPAADYEFGLFPIIKGLINGCSLLIHRSHFERAGTFDEKLRTAQDYDLFFKMFRGQRLVYIPQSLIKLRMHIEQTGHTSDKTVLEGDNLWLNMLKSLTLEEMRAIDSSVRQFWINQASFMKEYPPYKKKAVEYAYKQLKESVNELEDDSETCKQISYSYNRRNYSQRFFRALKCYGLLGFCKVFWKRVKTN